MATFPPDGRLHAQRLATEILDTREPYTGAINLIARSYAEIYVRRESTEDFLHGLRSAIAVLVYSHTLEPPEVVSIVVDCLCAHWVRWVKAQSA